MRTLLITPRHLGHLLASSRKARGITQAALARQLGLSQSRVSYLELHPEAMSVAQLMGWLAVLGLEMEAAPKAPPGAVAEPDSPGW